MTEYEPENDEKTLHIKIGAGMILNDILSKIQDQFGEDVNFDDVEISYENFHARHITYDLHDSSDWDMYLVVTKV